MSRDGGKAGRDILEMARETLSPGADHDLSEDECLEALGNLSSFIEILLEWDAAEDSAKSLDPEPEVDTILSPGEGRRSQ